MMAVPFDAMVWLAQTAQMPARATQRCVYDMAGNGWSDTSFKSVEIPSGSGLAREETVSVDIYAA